jgi:hypothetical protein
MREREEEERKTGWEVSDIGEVDPSIGEIKEKEACSGE